jgi:hypothetical protein
MATLKILAQLSKSTSLSLTTLQVVFQVRQFGIGIHEDLAMLRHANVTEFVFLSQSLSLKEAGDCLDMGQANRPRRDGSLMDAISKAACTLAVSKRNFSNDFW